MLFTNDTEFIQSFVAAICGGLTGAFDPGRCPCDPPLSILWQQSLHLRPARRQGSAGQLWR